MMIQEFEYVGRQKEAQRKRETISLAVFIEEEERKDHGI